MLLGFTPVNHSTLYRSARKRLTDAGIDTAAQDSRILVEHATGRTTEDLVCRPAEIVAEEVVAKLDTLLARRIAGEPPYRIIGQREFHGLHLKLSPDTLEPRPDTETLVDAVLSFARARTKEQGSCRILDLGTGTGAIALALTSQLPEANAVGTDVSQGALATARKNAKDNNLSDRFETILSDWFSATTGSFDLIVSNPPYIRSDIIPTLDREVREHDPLPALDGGADGLDAYRAIASGVASHLAEGGMVAVEIGFDQAESVTDIFAAHGFTVEPVLRDLSGNDRVLRMKMRQ